MHRCSKVTMNHEYSLMNEAFRFMDMDLVPHHFEQVHVSADLGGAARPGEHLAVKWKDAETEDVSWHHGIYLGSNRVAHLNKKYGLKEVSVSEFLSRDDQNFDTDSVAATGFVRYNVDTAERRALVVMRALHLLRHREASPIYHILLSNCECFATWCWTNRCPPPSLYTMYMIHTRIQ
jgi:hypothetical protein